MTQEQGNAQSDTPQQGHSRTSPEQHVMPAAQAVRLLASLQEAGVGACVGGGWAVDALVGKQTRRHSDLDLWVPCDQLELLSGALAPHGLDRLYPWPGDRPWNFVLHDGGRSRVDLHFVEDLGNRRLHYGGYATGETFPASALAGTGRIAGTTVRCETAAFSFQNHAGYPLRPVDHHDIALLRERFAVGQGGNTVS